jgi:hypothetical protein
MLIKTQSLRPSGTLGFYLFGLLQPAGYPGSRSGWDVGATAHSGRVRSTIGRMPGLEPDCSIAALPAAVSGTNPSTGPLIGRRISDVPTRVTIRPEKQNPRKTGGSLAF